MNPLEDLIERFKSIETQTDAIISESAEMRTEEIADTVISQLQQGQDGQGEFLPNYSKTSVNKFGKPDGPIKLFDQGDFYNAMDVIVEQDGLKVVNNDQKADFLIDFYGQPIVEIQDKNVAKIANEILVFDMLEAVEKRLGI